MLRPVRVLGIGSPAGDDRAGWLVAEAVSCDPRLADLPGAPVAVRALDRPGAGLLGHLEGAALVVLIDAVIGDAPPGTVRRLTMGEVSDGDAPLSSHGFGIPQALALARALDRLPARLVVYGIHARDAGPDASPSPAVLRAVPAVADRIVTELAAATDVTRTQETS